MQEVPRPQKKPCRTRVSLLSLKGTTWGGRDLLTGYKILWISLTQQLSSHILFCSVQPKCQFYTYLFWLCLRALIQRPRVIREVLMLVASFILSPRRCSLQRSDPARSHTVSLESARSKHGSAQNNVTEFELAAAELTRWFAKLALELHRGGRAERGWKRCCGWIHELTIRYATKRIQNRKPLAGVLPSAGVLIKMSAGKALVSTSSF